MERGKADVFTLGLSDVSYMCQAHRDHVCAFKSSGTISRLAFCHLASFFFCQYLKSHHCDDPAHKPAHKDGLNSHQARYFRQLRFHPG